MLGLERRPPSRLARYIQVRHGSLDEAEVVRRMRSPPSWPPSSCDEQLTRVLVDRLEHAEALAVGAYEALVDERAESVEISAAHVLHRLERAAADEHGEPTEERFLVVVEELDTPIDRVAQRSMPDGRVARTRG